MAQVVECLLGKQEVKFTPQYCPKKKKKKKKKKRGQGSVRVFA
jgi:hypothetical protein